MKPEEKSKPIANRGSYYSLSNVVTNDDFVLTVAFKEMIAKERPLAVAWTMIFILLSPLVFRYAMYASSTLVEFDIKMYQTANATIDAVTNWQCEECLGVPGVTLRNLEVNVRNVSNPNFVSGFPSVAVFASQDLKSWYNYFSTVDSDMPQRGFITNWHHTVIDINQSTSSAACLGGIYNNYLVICMNLQNIAGSLKNGAPIKGPPFNDRCFQVEGVCGIPCANLGDGQYPDFCDAGIMDTSMLVDNNITQVKSTEGSTPWGHSLSFFDWIILITIFLDTLGNILRFIPVLSGPPTEIESAKNIVCSGTAVLGCTTPIVAENEAIFLRGLVGRTLTCLHTVGSRHNVKGLYVDSILNESRKDGEDKRLQMWCAWIQFIECIGKMKTNEMDWERNLYDDSFVETRNDKKAVKIMRSIRFKKGNTAQFDCGFSRLMFEGVQNVPDKEPTFPIPEDGSSSSSYDSQGSSQSGLSVEDQSSDEDDMEEGGECKDLLSAEKEVHRMPRRPQVMKPNMKAASFDAIFDESNQRKKIDFLDVTADSSMYVDMENLLPLICFLNGWLEEIKQHDGVYNYKDKSEALRGIFNDAPYRKYFCGDQLSEVQDRLLLLYNIFNGDKIQKIPEEHFYARPELFPHKFLRQDEYFETMWTVTRVGLPDWQIAWSYFSRARLLNKQDPADVNLDVLRLQGTRVRKGSVVHLKVPDDVSALHALDKWFGSRERTYRVVDNHPRTTNGYSIKLEEWPLPDDTGGGLIPSDSSEKDGGEKGAIYEPEVLVRPAESVTLIEKNKGKAGALNVYLGYIRHRANKWAALNGVPLPVQTFAGIVDARHMIARPEVYWNEGLPFLARNEAKESEKVSTILVQYPQFFSNITRDDFLDNKNSGYYTIWQTLRDCANVCTSSGTNAIWDVTDVNFDFATTSRIEDTGTTQAVFAKNLTVHLPCFVAYGIAKDTEDYIEAVYRWSTGAVELFWSTLFSHQFSDFCIILLYVVVYANASFMSFSWAYFAWVLLVALTAASAYVDSTRGYKPIRQLNVSAVIVMNSLYWISNLSSVVWVVLVPFVIAFLSNAPMSASSNQAVTWAFVSLVLRFPTGIITDRLINMARFLMPKTVEDQWNYNLVLWRSSQLYVCSFAYTLLSLISGTRAAFRAKFYDGDNTLWSSFRISDDVIAKARAQLSKIELFSHQYLITLKHYLSLEIQKFVYSFTMPDAVTTWLAVGLYLFQIFCIIVSITFTNNRSASYILTTLIVCGLNIFLVTDIAMLLFPSMADVLGRPVRLEYMFGILSGIVILSLIWADTLQSSDYFMGLLGL